MESIQQIRQQPQNLKGMDSICLFGASGHGKVIKEIIESQGNLVLAFLDDAPKAKNMLNIPVLSSNHVNEFDSKKIIISIGQNEIRKKITQLYQLNYATAIHTKTSISNSSTIDEGSVLMSGVVVNADATIGKHCIINSNVVVEHDCSLDDFVHISPNATITGGVSIGEGTHVGAGAVVIPSVSIGKWVTIGAGTVILEDIPDYAVVVGNPGKIIKFTKID